MGTITINGRTFSGNNLSVVGGKIMIDGNSVEHDPGAGAILEVRIVEGTIGHIQTDCSVTCLNVDGDVRASGSISCGDVSGNAKAGGSISCGDVDGDVKAGGSVSCGSVRGRVRK